MKISNIEFTPPEIFALSQLAGEHLELSNPKFALMTGEQRAEFIVNLTPQNLLRAALDPVRFPLRQRGGKRPNTGNRSKVSAPYGESGNGAAGGRKKK